MKKAAAILLTILLTAVLVPTAQARSSTEFSATASSSAVYAGESVHFTLTTPSTAASAALYLDGRKQATPVTLRVDSGAARVWAADLMMEKTGTHKVRFYAYGQNGKLLARYPGTDIRISVALKLLQPITEDALVMEHDMAVLRGTLQTSYGVKYRWTGFYLGTSPEKMKRSTASKADGIHFNKLAAGLTPQTTYYIQACAMTTTGKLLKGEVKIFTTPEKTDWTAQTSLFPTSDGKYDYLFRSQQRYYTIDDPPLGYKTKAEAQKHMVYIRVPVWKISRGKRVASTMPLTVNRKLAENVKAIFHEIHALDMKYPIRQLYSYRYRKVSGPGAVHTSRIMSHHSFGAAMDINWSVNRFYLDGDHRDTKNPYCIPRKVIDIFAKYGWAWGGDFACGQDTMHFQYLGVELLP